MRLISSILAFVISIQVNAQINMSTVNLGGGITLTGSIEKFDSSRHIFDTCGIKTNQPSICLIDGRIWFGSDDGMELPRTQLRRLTLTINGTAIALDISGMYNPCGGNSLIKNHFKIKKEGQVYLLYGFFSDGAGTYTALWKIVKNRSIRLKISNDNADLSWQSEK